MYILTNYQQIYFNPEFAVTSDELRDGMMGRTFTNFDALVFILPMPVLAGGRFVQNSNDLTQSQMLQAAAGQDRHRQFWTKNCIIPLDIVFAVKVDNNMYQITSIYHNCQPCENNNCQFYQGIADIVIEFQGNTCYQNNILIGNYIFF